MQFAGPGTRLRAGDIGKIAGLINVETAVMLAVMEVEAAGSGFDTAKRPKILPERHRMWVELGPGPARDRAARDGLAYQKWGTRPYPKTSSAAYALLGRMMAVDENAALRATSWGLPQILGSNCLAAGYRTAREMVESFVESEYNQLQGMARLLVDWKLDRQLRGKDFTLASSWIGFARPYNGPSYATHNYHGRLATAYRKHQGKTDMAAIKGPTVLRRDMRGEEVRQLQDDLVALGFDPKGVDGRFGPGTEAAVRAFQASVGIKVDGIAGGATLASVTAALARVDSPIAPPAIWPGQEVAEGETRDFLAERAVIHDKLEALLGELRALDAEEKEGPK